MLQALIDEFENEVKSTRRLLQAVPASHIGFKPSPVSWSMGELAQHIATIYYWYVGTLTLDAYDVSADKPERGPADDIHATRDLFEANVEKARAALLSLKEEDLQAQWVMKSGDRTIMGPFPRGIVVRSFLFNHTYHHRGELIVYLRSTGNPVPGLYGPTFEESNVNRAK